MFPILTFHAIDDRPSVISFSPAVLEQALSQLHAAGYRTLTLLEAADYVSRRAPFPERYFAITFDDGYQSVYDKAFPLLRRYGMTATVFLTVGKRQPTDPSARFAMNGRPTLSWREILEMRDAGISFGAHTLTHPDLTCLPPHHAEEEILQSKAVIEQMLGTPVRSFAYPFGSYNTSCLEIVRRSFDCACSADLGFLSGHSDVHTLERLDAYYVRSNLLVELMLTRFFVPYIGLRAQLRRVKKAALSRSRSNPYGQVPITNSAAE